MIEKPSHYDADIDPIDVMEAIFTKEQRDGFYRGNALKYIMRADRKGGDEDIEKAIFYCKKILEESKG